MWPKASVAMCALAEDITQESKHNTCTLSWIKNLQLSERGVEAGGCRKQRSSVVVKTVKILKAREGQDQIKALYNKKSNNKELKMLKLLLN